MYRNELDRSRRLNQKHLQQIAAFYDQAPYPAAWASRQYRKTLARYYQLMIPPSAKVLEVGCGSGDLLAQLPNSDISGVDVSRVQIERARQRLPNGKFYVAAGEELNLEEKFDIIILADTINYAADVQQLFSRLRCIAHPGARLLLNFYNSLWVPLLSIGTAMGLKSKSPQNNWLSPADVTTLLDLAGWQLIKRHPRILLPVPFFGLQHPINRFLAPLLPWFCLTLFYVARPLPARGTDVSQLTRPSVSVVIPARNEAGNIEEAVRRVSSLSPDLEIIFVEGHSTDNTWEEIQRAIKNFPHTAVKALKQTGTGKANAVREAFAIAKNEILMILDADLTVPPEELPKFYDVLVSGMGEFVNGVRLVYPMEGKAMRFLNLCGNKAFSVAFTWVLDQPIKDTLCGTKVLWREDYDKIARNRPFFGEFDPFGDYDLLFGASRMNLKIVDLPIRYRERVYGNTNIHRWRHGWLLLKMVAFAARKIKFV